YEKHREVGAGDDEVPGRPRAKVRKPALHDPDPAPEQRSPDPLESAHANCGRADKQDRIEQSHPPMGDRRHVVPPGRTPITSEDRRPLPWLPTKTKLDSSSASHLPITVVRGLPADCNAFQQRRLVAAHARAGKESAATADGRLATGYARRK